VQEEKKSINRREFIGTATAAGALGALGLGALVSACSQKESAELNLPPLLEQAPDGPTLKAGVIGCGGRGTGASINFLDAGPNLEITALSDVFGDRVEKCRKDLREQRNVEIPDERCFVGFDAYQKLLETDIDLIITATPPYFRPMHFEAAVNARKHVFMEKPVAVDPVAARSIMSTAKKADGIGLCVVTGTQRRHQRDYIEVYKRVMDGAIGDIVSANCYWNQSQLWYRNRERGWTEMEWMIRDWVNWGWLSGDHIVEQHVHNIDVIHWFTGMLPVSAVGFGARHRRVTGDQYDSFSIDYVYENGMHVHSMCRQINGCANNVSEFIMGTKGSTNGMNKIWKPDGSVAYEYPYPVDESGEPTRSVKISPYVQEHIDLVTAIRTNTPVNEAENTAKSTLVAIMGRISAYTGKEVTWEEMMSSDFKLGPDELKLGRVDMKAVVPVPGTENR